MSPTIKIPIPSDGIFLGAGNLKWRESFEAEVSNPSDSIGWAKLFARYDEGLGRYVCSSLEVERAGEGADLTGAALRDLRVAEILQAAALQNIWVDSVMGEPAAPMKIDGEDYMSAAEALSRLRPVSGRTTDTDASNAVIAYSIANVSGMPVLKTIGEALITSQSTAKRLVLRARELGYLHG